MKNTKTSIYVKKRVILVFSLMLLGISMLMLRLGYVQVIKGEEYSKKAVESQKRDIEIPAKRGAIYDRNGKELATSSITYTVWARPDTIRTGNKEYSGDELMAKTVEKLSSYLNIPKEEISQKMNSGKARPKIAKYVDKNIAEKLQKEHLLGIEMDKQIKRQYPLGAFASHVLGSVTDDNHGLSGLELWYDKYLRGVPGRTIGVTDTRGNRLSVEKEKFFAQKDGLNLYLTIDEVIQHYVEKAIKNVSETTDADRVMCIVMNPKNGDILAMAMLPEYNPNVPRIPLDPEEAELVEAMTDEEKLEHWNIMWRNPMVSDVFEPGSTFKLLTTAIALEEQKVGLNSHFKCEGYKKIADKTIKCWRYPRAHGIQNLTEAVGHSCNPAFVDISSKIGVETYYDYLDSFGIMDKSNIDYPGETRSIVQKIDNIGPVELATMSYGHGVAVTPLKVLTAISSFGNEGKVMQPRLVKKMVDGEGKIVKEFPEKVVNRVVSKATVDEVKNIMEQVVEQYGGKIAKVSGYRIGGKSGTTLKIKDGEYSDETYGSFVAMAPMEDPQISVIVAVDNPKNSMYGSVTAGPGIKMIIEDTLRYLDIKPNYTKAEQKAIDMNKKIVPDLKNMNFSEAKEILLGQKLNFVISPKFKENEEVVDFVIVDQFPKAGEMIKDEKIYLYRK